MKTPDFVALFKRVKEEKKGVKSRLQGLSEPDEKKLKAIVKRGYTYDVIEGAIAAMFDDPEQWAVNSGNDIPTHFLRQFDRYVNLYERSLTKKEPKAQPAAKTPEEIEAARQEQQAREWLEMSKEEYTKSLKFGDWRGSILDAARIGPLFAGSFTQPEKSEFFKLASAKAADRKDDARTGETDMRKAVFAELATPENLFAEIVVIEAVKRKIPEPWK